MTKQQAVTIGDLAWKILVPLFLAISGYALNSVAAEIRDLRSEIKGLRSDVQSLYIDLAHVKTRIDYHEKASQ